MKKCRETKDYSQMFRSERNMNLISNTPDTITIEDDRRLSDLYYITKNEKDNNYGVYNLGDLYPGGINRVEGICDGEPMSPLDIVKFAIEKDLKIEYLSYAAICQIFIEDCGAFNIPDEHLPTYEDLNKVLIDGNDITEEMNYCEAFGLYPEHFDKEMCLKSYSKKVKEVWKFNYAKCISSYNGFIEGEIYRVTNPVSQESGECFYILQENSKTGICKIDYTREICTEDIDYFMFIINTDISSISVIKKIFDLLQD